MSNWRDSLWTTKCGEKIRLRDLEDTHLAHIITYLERKAIAEFDSTPYPQSNGEMAQLELDAQYATFIQEGPEGLLPRAYDFLVMEQELRKELREKRGEPKMVVKIRGRTLTS